MMKLNSVIWLTILALVVFTAGAVVTPCVANASNSPIKAIKPTITHDAFPYDTLYQSPLYLRISTDKSVYLTGETVNIAVSTNAFNTHIKVLAQLPGSSQETIGSLTTNTTNALSWQAPTTSGLIRLTCEGQAIMDAWDTCSREVCEGEDCWWEDYPCVRSIRVTGNAYTDIRVFSRTTSISGYIIDTNQRPVPGATVSLASNMQSITSNSDGYYEFSSYELNNNFALVNEVPTVTETISVEAIACESQAGKTVQVQAERGVSDVNFTMKRVFYPPNIDLSEFNFNAFPNWQEARQYSTWQNMLGITTEGAVEPGKLSYGKQEIPPRLFSIGNKQLYLVTNPGFGRYTLELKGSRNTGYTVAAATTLNGSYFQPVTVSGNVEGKNDQKLRLTLNAGGVGLQAIKPTSPLLIIIPIAVLLLGGLAAAYFLNQDKFRGLWKKPAVVKSPEPKTRVITKTEDDSTATKINKKPAAKKTRKKGVRKGGSNEKK